MRSGERAKGGREGQGGSKKGRSERDGAKGRGT